jgi:hypothetical protein
MTRRTALHVVMLLSVLAAAFAVAEHVLRQHTPCHKCGASMRAFMEGDPQREDSDILECPKCGYLVNTRHTRR